MIYLVRSKCVVWGQAQKMFAGLKYEFSNSRLGSKFVLVCIKVMSSHLCQKPIFLDLTYCKTSKNTPANKPPPRKFTISGNNYFIFNPTLFYIIGKNAYLHDLI